MAETPAQALAGFMAKYTPSMAKEGRAALARMRKLVPGAVQFVYDNWNGLVVGFGPTERPSEAVVSIIMLRITSRCVSSRTPPICPIRSGC